MMKNFKSNILVAILATILFSFTVMNAQEVLSEGYAVNLGFPISYSTIYNEYDDIFIPRINIANNCWAAKTPDLNQWIQVSSSVPLKWLQVVTQGRPNVSQWVTKYKVAYSLDGNNWNYVDSGNIFNGNYDSNTPVYNKFNKAVVARAIRIVPTAWSGWISLRFDFTFDASI